MYKRIADIETEEEWQDMQDELIDRFGDMPKAVQNLLDIVLIKSMAHATYISQIKQKREQFLDITMFEKAKIKVENIPVLLEKYNGRLTFMPQKLPLFQFKWSKEKRPGKEDKKKNFVGNIKELLRDMKEILCEQTEKKN